MSDMLYAINDRSCLVSHDKLKRLLQKANPPNGSLGIVQVLSIHSSAELKEDESPTRECRDRSSPVYS